MSDENVTDAACELPSYADAYQKARQIAIRKIYASMREAIDAGDGNYSPGFGLQWVMPLKAGELPDGYKQVQVDGKFKISWDTEPCTSTGHRFFPSGK